MVWYGVTLWINGMITNHGRTIVNVGGARDFNGLLQTRFASEGYFVRHAPDVSRACSFIVEMNPRCRRAWPANAQRTHAAFRTDEHAGNIYVADCFAVEVDRLTDEARIGAHVDSPSISIFAYLAIVEAIIVVHLLVKLAEEFLK